MHLLLRRCEQRQRGEVTSAAEKPAEQRRPGHQRCRPQARWPLGLTIWHHSGPEGLNHPLPLGENGLTGSVPPARTHQAVLIRGAGTRKSLPSQFRVLDKEPQQVWPNPDESSKRVAVRDVVHHDGITHWACKSEKEVNSIFLKDHFSACSKLNRTAELYLWCMINVSLSISFIIISSEGRATNPTWKKKVSRVLQTRMGLKWLQKCL